ncbi:uncharacterized protein LOC123896592 [Trifolium pratense]|uniref:uncharacterized protein LOC123896592 n=1 Tax=Trifolium pratense TaxID=57577 RepID=UPI001E698332|nr:uncharacterized protein LOC123896592 [Trifolium pratense]
MGCCISTPKDDQNTLKTQQNTTQEPKCIAPPPQPKSPPLIVEEEFVKEILFETETPISKPQQVPILTQETKTQMQNMETTKDPIINKPLEEPSEEVSIISETCSVGESYSTTTTTTVPETREDEVTSKRRIREGSRNRNRNRNHSDGSRKRSYAGERSRIGGREQRRSKSPARVPEIPPEKKVVVGSRLDRRREFSDKVRRDSGEVFRRRSRSPSCQRTVGSSNTCRSELRQMDRAGRRFPPPGKCENEEVVVERNDGVLMEESIMNPHVSLECFIFL